MKHLPQEDQRLNERLNEQSQLTVREWMKALPDEEPSMAWRAQLNERLRTLPGSAKRLWWQAMWKPAGGLVLAACLTVVILMRPYPASKPSSGVEVADALIAAHGQSVAQVELGMAAPVDSLRSDVAMPTQWEEIDLGTL